MTIGSWALRWAIPYAAIVDLHTELGMLDPEPGVPGKSEAAVQAAVRVEASQKGMRVFRNNVGVLEDRTGRPLRFGIANDSPAMNRKLKSGDLIGIDPTPITAADVGQPRGQFVSLECKPEGWHYAGTPHEEAQAAWAALVVSLGGRARFVNRVGLL